MGIENGVWLELLILFMRKNHITARNMVYLQKQEIATGTHVPLPFANLYFYLIRKLNMFHETALLSLKDDLFMKYICL